jgi:cytosine/adenosine deaminase-related metal-dependent hydrolase
MEFRRVSANYVISPDSRPIKNGVLEFADDGTLTAIIDPAEKELPHVEWYNGVLVPGFVNAHCHLELSQLKDKIPAHTQMDGFIGGIFATRGQYPYNEADVKAADEAMFREGVVAVGDVCNTNQSSPVKAQSKICYHNFYEALGLNPAQAENTVNQLQHYIESDRRLNLRASIAPHAIYSVSEALWLALKPLVGGQLSSFHFMESPGEIEMITRHSGKVMALMQKISPDGKPPLPAGKDEEEMIRPFLSAARQLLLVHNCMIDESIARKLSSWPIPLHFVLCPQSNRYIGNPAPDIDILRRINASICLGTDSLSSNTNLSMCSEMKLAQQQWPHIPFQEILGWVTLNGARALETDTVFGSFEPGKKPGAVLLSSFDFEKFRLSEKTVATRMV